MTIDKLGPLRDVRVLDLTTVLMGPYATQVLAEFGADVIKVEAPEGDIVRQIGSKRNRDMSGLFLNTNRGKRSIVLNLKAEENLDCLYRLVASSDVMLSNLRPKSMDRLGLSYDRVQRENPAIIYAGIYGYGEGGPYAGKPAYDDLIQGASGVGSLFGQGGEPRYMALAIADRVCGLHAVTCILAALHHRDRTGEGQQIEIPMFETMVSMVLGDHMAGLTFSPPLDEGGYARLLAADRRPLRTKDGYVCALIYNDKHWKRFFEMLGRDDFHRDGRYRDHATRTDHIDEIYRDLAVVFMTKTSAEWISLLDAADIPVMPLHSVATLLEDPHLKAVNFFEISEHPTEGAVQTMRMPSRWSRTHQSELRPAPRLGEHSDEIRRELGCSLEQRSNA